MTRGQTSGKKEKERQRLKKRTEKQQNREARKADKTPKSFEDMIAYVDEFGRITSTAPDPSLKTVVKAEDIELDITARNKQEEETDLNGSVKFFNTEKGFGFLIEKVTNESYFFHMNGLIDKIKENDKVSFRIQQGKKGPEAFDIRLLPAG